MKYDVTICPSCGRRLQLPAEHFGAAVKCPSCETTFIAGDPKPQPAPPRNPASTADTPVEASVPAIDLGAEAPHARRSRRRQRPKPAPRKSRFMTITLALVIGACVVIAGLCMVGAFLDEQRNQQFFNQAPPFDFNIADAPPFVDLPNRILNPEE